MTERCQPGNGLPNGEDPISDDDYRIPITPLQDRLNDAVQGNSKAYKFFESIDWRAWWTEFSSSVKKNGRLLYGHSWTFARKKAKNIFERNVIYECIGPFPGARRYGENKGKRRVPWLGDWEKIRCTGWAFIDDPATLASIKQAIKEREDAIRASRAIGPLIVIQMQRGARLAQKIDEAFGGEPFLPDEPPDSQNNKRRFAAYVKMHRAAFEHQQQAWNWWLRCHGLDPSKPETYLALLGAGEAAAAQTGQQGGVTLILPPGITPTDLEVAKMMREKRVMYNLALPEEMEGEVGEPLDPNERRPPARPNCKGDKVH